MAEVDKVVEVFWKVKENPPDYIPEKSIWALRDFLHGYAARVQMEGVASQMSYIYREFELWLATYFGLRPQSRSVYEIVDLYSSGPEDAFTRFYDLFESFRRKRSVAGNNVSVMADVKSPSPLRIDVCEILRRIRSKPELYVGYPNLAGINCYLQGHERAGGDLGLLKTVDEELYDDFKRWVENERFPLGSPRPWFKLIRFYSVHDCGLKKGSAYTAFFELLDTFAVHVGRPGLFEISADYGD